MVRGTPLAAAPAPLGCAAEPAHYPYPASRRTGASFTGSASAVGADGLHYRGFGILTAILADMKAKHGITT